MSLTINDYKNWAAENQRSTVVLNNDATGLVKQSARIGRVGRLLFRGTVNELRGAVMKDFTRALSSRYGVSIAQQAISMAGLTSKSELKGSKIARAIAAAKSIRAQMLQPAEGQTLRLGNTEVSRNAIAGFIGDKDNAVTKLLKEHAVAVQLLGEMPLCEAEYNDFRNRLWDLMPRLTNLIDSDNIPEGIPAEDFKSTVRGLVKALYDKDAEAHELINSQPLGETNLNEYKEVWCEAATHAMVNLASDAVAKGENNAAAAITHAIIALGGDNDVRRQFNDSIVQFSHGASKNYVAPFVINLIKRQFAAENVRNFRIGKADLIKKIDAGFQKNLNERPWLTVDKSILSTLGKRPVSLKSTIVPAEHLGHANGSDRGPIASRYPIYIHGYMCDSSTADHAVNLSVSSIAVGDPDGAHRTAFTGVRHGVHSAWGIRDANARAAANARRAEEAVIAAFLAKFDAPGNPQDLPAQGEDGKTTVDLNITSVALLTPGTARHFYAKGSDKDERRMLMDQSAAWESVEQNGVEFQFKGRTVKIRPRILKFNFGVNEGAINKIFRLTPNMFGGWDISKQMNRAAISALGEEVNAFLHSDADQRTKDAALTLFDQCQRVLDNKAERKDSHDAFKVAARIAVLSNLIGKVPCWNCKSGKDRTGQMDVECKFLATLIARGEPIPEPGKRLSKEHQTLLRSIALEGGNFEIQKMNTAIAGFKTGSINSVTERLGGSAYRQFHRGGSDHVNV